MNLFYEFCGLLMLKMPNIRKNMVIFRDRRDRKFRDDTDIDTFCGPESRPILIPILFVALNRDRYWYWYHKNVPGLILIPILYLIRILPGPCKKCSGLWIDTGTDTETQKKPRSRPILIPKGLVSAFSIRYWYSRLSLVSRAPVAKNKSGLESVLIRTRNWMDIFSSIFLVLH